MHLLEYGYLALKGLQINRLRSFLTMLGILVGVTAIIMLVSLGEGAKVYVTQLFAEMGTNTFVVTPGKAETTGGHPIMGSFNKLTLEDARAIERRAQAVQALTADIIGTGKVKYQNRARDTAIIGVSEDYQEVVNQRVDIGAFFTRADVEGRRRLCVLGRVVNRDLFPAENPLGKMVKINNVKFRVIGIMEEKGRSLGINFDDMVFIPVTAAQALFNTDRLYEIVVAAVNEKEIDTAVQEVTKILRERHGGKIDFTIVTQGAMLSTFRTILSALTYLLAGIAGVSLLVGGIGIMNIMLASVTERTREIGVRKAVGAKRRHILFQFLTEALILSATGGVIGIVLGWGGAALLNAWIFPSISPPISLWAIALAFFFSLLVGTFFGVYPAQKASRLDPIEALRHE
ncbi:MAG: FtsX-like permease family protein [Nitrospinota bacterium]|nr:MAG: FtsX-like permease family protein [Nitrospinota bacterium]